MEEASGEMKKMQDSIKQLQLENQSLQTRLDNENQTAKLRLKEMQRKQQDFKQLLQQEGISAALV